MSFFFFSKTNTYARLLFFFQAEDGIRDLYVTGVQTCALPILGKAGRELATTEQPPSGAFDLGDGTVDVLGVHEPKAEMCDARTETGGGGVLGEGDDVVPTRSLSVDESISAPVLAQTEDLFVEPQRASQIPDGEIDMSKAVGLNHCYFEILSTPGYTSLAASQRYPILFQVGRPP